MAETRTAPSDGTTMPRRQAPDEGYPVGGRVPIPTPDPDRDPRGPRQPRRPRKPKTEAEQSAYALITNTLAEFGLGALAAWAWNEYLHGKQPQLIFLEMKDRPEYKKRFPAMDALAQAGHGMTEAEYIATERSLIEVFRSRGLPEGFYDHPDDLTKFLTNMVSPKELDDRLALRELAAAQNPRAQRLREELSRLYGVPEATSLATAWFINPDIAEPIIQRRVQSALTGTAALESGFGTLTQSEAERVGGTGVGVDQAVGTFSTLAGMKELTQALPGDESKVSREDLLAAGFEGNQAAQEKIRREGKSRAGQFASTGGYATTERGLSGLGKATT